MKPISLLWSQPARLPTLMKNHISSPAEETAIPYTDRELFQRALMNLPRIVKPARIAPRWVLVKELFACGEDVAHRICWRHGFDPDTACGTPASRSNLPSLPWGDLDDGK